MRSSCVVAILFLFIVSSSLAQRGEKKWLQTHRVEVPPVVDGVLNDSVWCSAALAKDFTQTVPYNGSSATQNTEVRIVYDDNAIYVGAALYDTAPDSIMLGLGKRDAEDDDINADLFSVEFNPYNDGQQLYAFKVSASGTQVDERITYNQWDKSWDAVWYSKVTKTDFGWCAELKIPFSALRIPSQRIQTWGLHIWRLIKRSGEWNSWNFVDESVVGTTHQVGLLTGIVDVKPPLRLSITPYLTAYLDYNSRKHNSETSLKGGLDLKYGINESFTLDMMVVPDFGQIPSDDRVLNLTSVETYYSDKRGFFTEGMDLFSRGGIFYSRRIGSKPRFYDSVVGGLGVNELISNNPTESQLINATKFSGRTQGGLGVGLLNAIGPNVYATVEDTVQNTFRHILTQPAINYNLVVFDQSLSNNSYVSIVNSNVTFLERDYAANVVATDFKFSNKSNTYAIIGKGAFSHIGAAKNKDGFFSDLAFRKTSGKLRFNVNNRLLTARYDPTDLGYLENNNAIYNDLTVEYNYYNPVWIFRSWFNNFRVNNAWLYKPTKYAMVEVHLATSATFNNYMTMGLYGGATPIKKYDFFEPRVEGWKYEEPTAFYVGANYNSDRKRILSLYVDSWLWRANEYRKQTWQILARPSLRIGNRFTAYYEVSREQLTNAIGYANKTADNDTIFFGRRNVRNITNTFAVNYMFSSRSALNLRSRYYWSAVEYKQFYILKRDGAMDDSYIGVAGDDINYSAFTIDLAYTWQFAPGSELSVVWKNVVSSSSNIVSGDYFKNLDRTVNLSQLNSLSFKILYYLDSQYFQKRK